MLIIAQVLFWLPLVFVVVNVVAIACSDRPKRSRIDWEHVYAMERDVWGETFEHIDAPLPGPPWPNGAPTGISTHYAHNPFSNPAQPLSGIGIERAAAYLARNEHENLAWEKAKYDY